jgi:hypothetical protein
MIFLKIKQIFVIFEGQFFAILSSKQICYLFETKFIRVLLVENVSWKRILITNLNLNRINQNFLSLFGSQLTEPSQNCTNLALALNFVINFASKLKNFINFLHL